MALQNLVHIAVMLGDEDVNLPLLVLPVKLVHIHCPGRDV